MSDLKIAKRWARRWSKYYTDITNSKITFWLKSRGYGMAHTLLKRLKHPKMIKALKKLATHTKHQKKLKCSRKHVKRRGVK